jgi:hypothetical protein
MSETFIVIDGVQTLVTRRGPAGDSRPPSRHPSIQGALEQDPAS